MMRAAFPTTVAKPPKTKLKTRPAKPRRVASTGSKKAPQPKGKKA